MARSFYRFIAEEVEASMIVADVASELAMTEEAVVESADVDVEIQEAIIEAGLVKAVSEKGVKGRERA